MKLKEWKEVVKDPDKVIEVHSCSSNKRKTTGVIKCQFEGRPEKVWMIASVWIAGKEEVIDGEADEIGEIMSSSMIAINFCPFCGDALN